MAGLNLDANKGYTLYLVDIVSSVSFRFHQFFFFKLHFLWKNMDYLQEFDICELVVTGNVFIIFRDISRDKTIWIIEY